MLRVSKQLKGLTHDGNQTQIEYVTPEMFGAKGDGVSDDTKYVQRAINSKLSVVCENSYAITGVDAKGIILGGRFLSYDRKDNDYLFNVVGDVLFDDVTIDCISTTQRNPQSNPNVGIKQSSSCALYINNCVFRNLYSTFVDVFRSSGDLRVEGSTFDATNDMSKYANICINITSGTYDGEYYIANNNFAGNGQVDNNASAIFLAVVNKAKAITIRNNTMKNLGKKSTPEQARICVIDAYFNVNNLTIDNNQIIDCTWSPIRFHGVQNCLCNNNRITLANQYIGEWLVLITDTRNSDGSSPVGVDKVVISNNTFDTQGNRIYYGIQVNSDEVGRIDNIRVLNNRFIGVYNPSWFVFGGTLKHATIKNNEVESGALQSYQNYKMYRDTELLISNNKLRTIRLYVSDGIKLKVKNNILIEESEYVIRGEEGDMCIYATNNTIYGNSVATNVCNLKYNKIISNNESSLNNIKNQRRNKIVK